MPLSINRYDVALARDGLDLDKALDAGEGDGYDVHRVTVMHADQLVAEQAAPRVGLPPLSEDNPSKQAWATLWCWCAMRRMQIAVPEFPPFKSRLIDISVVTPDKPASPETGDELDPTDQPLGTGLP